jgi:metal-responsive CopG/Arc/MetJ family transcriptional regulator
MTPKKFTALRLDEELLEGLREVWERDGVSVSEQIRRAVRTWLKSRGVVVVKPAKSERKRPASRKRLLR